MVNVVHIIPQIVMFVKKGTGKNVFFLFLRFEKVNAHEKEESCAFSFTKSGCAFSLTKSITAFLICMGRRAIVFCSMKRRRQHRDVPDQGIVEHNDG